jgi:hypothetical protein
MACRLDIVILFLATEIPHSCLTMPLAAYAGFARRPDSNSASHSEQYATHTNPTCHDGLVGISASRPAFLYGFARLEGFQNSAGKYPLISRPMQISTSLGVVQAIRLSSGS